MGYIGFRITLYLNDDEFAEGILLSVNEDHLVIYVKGHIFYVPFNKIQALLKNAKDFYVSTPRISFIKKAYLIEVLAFLKSKYITINNFSSRTFTGMLCKVAEDHIILMADGQLMFIQKEAICSVYEGVQEIREQKQETIHAETTQKIINQPKLANDLALKELPEEQEETARNEKSLNHRNEQSRVAPSYNHKIRQLRKPPIKELPSLREWLIKAKLHETSSKDLQNSNALTFEKELETAEEPLCVDKQETFNRHRKLATIRLKNFNHYKQFVKMKNDNQEIQESVIDESSTPDNRITILHVNEEKTTLAFQYGALMKHAKKMYHADRDADSTAKKQYHALMKHAEKMYEQSRGLHNVD